VNDYANLKAEPQKPISVMYKNIVVGNFAADILVEDKILLELKVAKAIEEIHEAQLLNYLKATKLRLGLILNFGTPKLGVRRKVA
jgi:GxxExxY protein